MFIFVFIYDYYTMLMVMVPDEVHCFMAISMVIERWNLSGTIFIDMV